MSKFSFHRLAGNRGKVERFLVLELTNRAISLTPLARSAEGKQTLVSQTVRAPADFGDQAGFFTRIAGLMKKAFTEGSARILLSLDERFAGTVRGNIALIRENPKAPITEADLENVVAQGVWKMFDRERSRAAKRLGTDDVELRLADVRLERIKLDGHRVRNPLDFPARVVELQLRETLVSDKWYSALLEVLEPAPVEFVTSASALMGCAAARLFPLSGGFLLAHILERETVLMRVADGGVSYLDAIEWGAGNFVTALAANTGAPWEEARRLYRWFLAGRGSASLLSKLRGKCLEEAQLLANGLHLALEKHELPTVCIAASAETPAFLGQPALAAQFPKAARILVLAPETIAGALPGEVEYGEGAGMLEAFTPLAVFLEYQRLPANVSLRRAIDRRIRWMSPQKPYYG